MSGLSFVLAVVGWIVLVLAICVFVGRRLRALGQHDCPIFDLDEYRDAVKKVSE